MRIKKLLYLYNRAKDILSHMPQVAVNWTFLSAKEIYQPQLRFHQPDPDKGLNVTVTQSF